MKFKFDSLHTGSLLAILLSISETCWRFLLILKLVHKTYPKQSTLMVNLIDELTLPPPLPTSRPALAQRSTQIVRARVKTGKYRGVIFMKGVFLRHLTLFLRAEIIFLNELSPPLYFQLSLFFWPKEIL